MGLFGAQAGHQPQKHDGAIGNGVRERNLLATHFAPLQLGFFDEECLVLVPPGDLNRYRLVMG
jgi:hypothetical protein